MCFWECDWRNKKRSEWPSPSLACDVHGCTNIAIAGARERVFYIARRAPRGAIQGVAYSPNG